MATTLIMKAKDASEREDISFEQIMDNDNATFGTLTDSFLRGCVALGYTIHKDIIDKEVENYLYAEPSASKLISRIESK